MFEFLVLVAVGTLAMGIWAWWYAKAPKGVYLDGRAADDYYVLLLGGGARVVEYWWAQMVEMGYLIEPENGDLAASQWTRNSKMPTPPQYWLARAWLEVPEKGNCSEIATRWQDVIEDLENHVIDDGWLEPTQIISMLQAASFPFVTVVLMLSAIFNEELPIGLGAMFLTAFSVGTLLISPPSARQTLTQRGKVLRDAWVYNEPAPTSAGQVVSHLGARALRDTSWAKCAIAARSFPQSARAYCYEGGGGMRFWARKRKLAQEQIEKSQLEAKMCDPDYLRHQNVTATAIQVENNGVLTK